MDNFKDELRSLIKLMPNHYARYLQKSYPSLYSLVSNCYGKNVAEKSFNFLNDHPRRICLFCLANTNFYGITRGYADYCSINCITLAKREKLAKQYELRLTNLGYIVHSDLKLLIDNKQKIEVTNKSCSHRYFAQASNILNGSSKCAICGPIHRIKSALSGYLKKYRRDYDYELWNDYLVLVRKESEKTYRQHIDKLNPNRLSRSRPDLQKDCVQLDHIVPIIECFKRGWDIDEAAGLNNLRIIDAIENLKKKQKLIVKLEEIKNHPERFWINNNKITRFVSAERREILLREGWINGKKEITLGDHVKGKIWINDGSRNVRIFANELIPNEWTRGKITKDIISANVKRSNTWKSKRNASNS